MVFNRCRIDSATYQVVYTYVGNLVKRYIMSDLNDFKLGGYHNAGGHIRDGTGGERVRPMSDELPPLPHLSNKFTLEEMQHYAREAVRVDRERGLERVLAGVTLPEPTPDIQAFVDALPRPKDRLQEYADAFAVKAITAWQARPLPEVDEIMRLADAYHESAEFNKMGRGERNALEAAVRQQAAEIRTLRNVGVTQLDRIVELENQPICKSMVRRLATEMGWGPARIAAVSEPLINGPASASTTTNHVLRTDGGPHAPMSTSPVTDKDAISPLADVEDMCFEVGQIPHMAHPETTIKACQDMLRKAYAPVTDADVEAMILSLRLAAGEALGKDYAGSWLAGRIDEVDALIRQQDARIEELQREYEIAFDAARSLNKDLADLQHDMTGYMDANTQYVNEIESLSKVAEQHQRLRAWIMEFTVFDIELIDAALAAKEKL